MIKAYGIDHVTLTVSDLKRTKKFYENLFGVKLKEHRDGSFHLLSVGVPCWFVQWKKQFLNDKFNERRIGLDHIAFELKTISELKKVVAKLGKMNVATEGLQKFGGKFPYVCFRDPDNIQTEFFISKI